MQGGTTTEIVEQGNIREDMFRLLVTAELVIADVSIHNANVFYELGIRHGLRAQDTFLLRANVDKYPFDLATDRYLVYDTNDPAATVKELTRALKATLVSKRVDSPVYQVLPSLRPPGPVRCCTSCRGTSWKPSNAPARAATAATCGFSRTRRETSSGAVEGLRTVGRAQVKRAGEAGGEGDLRMAAGASGRRTSRPTSSSRRSTRALAELQEQRTRSADCLARSTQAIQRVIDVQGTTRT